VVTSLQRKLLRDLWTMRGQILAIMGVVACGIASYVAMLSAHGSLARAAETYFDRHRFPDVFAQVAYAPERVAHQVADVPGVDAVEPRLVRDVAIDVRGLPEPATGRLVSLPERGQSFNVLHLSSGRMPEAFGGSEVVVSKAFADAHELRLGETVGAIVEGRKATLRMVGTALSPEYISSVGPGSLFPDDLRFGVFWMAEDELAA
jgi:putative ABC transport system permease protein